MKDKRLENEFDEYFKGLNISDDIIEDAKKAVVPKRRILPKIVKFASIAASIVLVFALSLTFMLNAFSPKKGAGNGSGSLGTEQPDSEPPSSSAPGVSGDENSSGKFVLYADSDLTKKSVSAYTLSSLDSSLNLIENFALADNASVEYCKAGYNMNDKLVLVEAKVNILSGLVRDETTIFVEFTDKNLVYDELESYYGGTIQYFRGAQYYLTQTTSQNGEPEFKLHIYYGGVKYYFNVHSSDIKAYEKYLQMVAGK